MLKVCFLCSNYEIGGLEKMIYNLSRRLDPTRFDISICLLRDRGKFATMMSSAAPGRLKICSSLFAALHYIRENDFSVIHSFGLKSDLLSRLPMFRTGSPTIFSCVANPDLAHSVSRRIWNLISARSVDSFWADCRYRADQGIRWGGIPSKKIEVIYPGIDMDEFSPAEASIVDHPFPIIGCVGNVRFIKGHQVVLEAIPAIVSKFPEALFYFVGSDFTGGKMASIATKLGVTRHVRFIGFQEDVRHYMRMFQLLLHPSFSEGLPRAILEAMSLEKPVIASTVGGIPEIITSGENGILVPPGDPALLAEKTLDLLRDPQLMDHVRKQARMTIRTKFRMDQMISGFQQMYSRVIEKSK